MRAGRVILYFLMLASVFPGAVPGQNSRSVDKPKVEALQLPSFSIFGLPIPGTENAKDLLDPAFLEKFLVEVEKNRDNDSAKEDYPHSIIPMIFYQARL
jgi:hypothetical protein